MQKHQEWLDNRTYQQHLMSLTKIRQNFRKSQVKSAINARRRRQSNKQMSQDQLHSPIQPKQKQIQKQKQNQHSHSPRTHKNMQISSRQKQLLWNNFLLGKRIMETNPVISVKKHEDQYRKHKKMIDWRMQRTKKIAVNTDFRETKLKEYTENTHRMSNCFRLSTAIKSRYILCLKIVRINPFRPHPHLDDLLLKLITPNKKPQSSQLTNIQTLPFYQFYFKHFPLRLSSSSPSQFCPSSTSPFPSSTAAQSHLLVDIYEAKGLEERHFGGFLIQREKLNTEKQIYVKQLRRTGKIVGEIEFQVFVGRRREMKG